MLVCPPSQVRSCIFSARRSARKLAQSSAHTQNLQRDLLRSRSTPLASQATRASRDCQARPARGTLSWTSTFQSMQASRMLQARLCTTCRTMVQVTTLWSWFTRRESRTPRTSGKYDFSIQINCFAKKSNRVIQKMRCVQSTSNASRTASTMMRDLQLWYRGAKNRHMIACRLILPWCIPSSIKALIRVLTLAYFNKAHGVGLPQTQQLQAGQLQHRQRLEQAPQLALC